MNIEDYTSWLPDITLLRKRWRVLKDNPERAIEDIRETQEVFSPAYLEAFTRQDILLIERIFHKEKYVHNNFERMCKWQREGLVTSVWWQSQATKHNRRKWIATKRGRDIVQAWHDMHNAMKAETP